MQTHCDEFVNGDVYLGCGRNATKIATSPRTESQNLAPAKTQPPKTQPQTTMPAKSQVPTLNQLSAIQTLLTRAWQTKGFDQPFNLSRLGAQLKKMNSGLDWKEYGFKSLKPMVAQMVTMGYLGIELTNGSDERIFLVNRESQTPLGTGTVSVSSGPFSEHESVHGAAREMELVAMMKSLVNESIRWDNLRALLQAAIFRTILQFEQILKADSI